jgi:hypothetical protein
VHELCGRTRCRRCNAATQPCTRLRYFSVIPGFCRRRHAVVAFYASVRLLDVYRHERVGDERLDGDDAPQRD